ncbi:hypothetical protein V2J09_022376 [Rumex salicifolius]
MAKSEYSCSSTENWLQAVPKRTSLTLEDSLRFSLDVRRLHTSSSEYLELDLDLARRGPHTPTAHADVAAAASPCCHLGKGLAGRWWKKVLRGVWRRLRWRREATTEVGAGCTKSSSNFHTSITDAVLHRKTSLAGRPAKYLWPEAELGGGFRGRQYHIPPPSRGILSSRRHMNDHVVC